MHRRVKYHIEPRIKSIKKKKENIKTQGKKTEEKAWVKEKKKTKQINK